MNEKILLTSFQTWMLHQTSNASDDLLELVAKQEFSTSLTFLRQLPVDVSLAASQVISKIEELQPGAIICCGMAESRQVLTVESCACGDGLDYKTSVDLDKLLVGLSITEISHDAGKFVCEGLYYEVLKYLNQLNISCIFVHVPVLTAENWQGILADFQIILERIGCIF
ncbi:MAG: peptidase C15 [Coleofasciculaceae cyanobacterium]